MRLTERHTVSTARPALRIAQFLTSINNCAAAPRIVPRRIACMHAVLSPDPQSDPNNAGASKMIHRNRCQNCSIRSVSLCNDISAESSAELSRIVHRIRIPEGRIVYGSDERQRMFGIVVAGVVKLVNARPDGRQQIVGLQFPSDFFGRPYTGAPGLFAEAATDLELCCFSGAAFDNLLAERRDIERALLKRVLLDLDAARDWMFLLGRKTAEEKVASFLAMISDRMNLSCATTQPAMPSGHIRLPLSRTEIADCLSLRLETVSRQFALLKSRGIVETQGRRAFKIRDMSALKRFSESVATVP